MTEQNSEPIEVFVRQLGKDTDIDRILDKTLRVLRKSKLLEPVRNLLHWLHRLSGWRPAELWTTARKRYPNISSMARPVLRPSRRGSSSIFTEVVRRYRCALPRRARHDNNN